MSQSKNNISWKDSTPTEEGDRIDSDDQYDYYRIPKQSKKKKVSTEPEPKKNTKLTSKIKSEENYSFNDEIYGGVVKVDELVGAPLNLVF
jgi:hypothetical protein